MVRYAFLYGGPTSSNYNSDYRNFETSGNAGGDCTNFISQELRTGGWSDVLAQDYSNRADTTLWWYSPINQTYTWTSAAYFYQFLSQSSRATPMSHSSDLLPGDVIQADWGDPREPGITHSMVVSTKHNDGTINVTYHSNATVDRPLQEIVDQSPDASFYTWHMNDNFSFLPKPKVTVSKAR
ncbi:MAG: amidase domain-containing protein [Nostocaceae cyanobacterium]|nr:amidase domain-containing protein [Nostocaceae cyanobacterium]